MKWMLEVERVIKLGRFSNCKTIDIGIAIQHTSSLLLFQSARKSIDLKIGLLLYILSFDNHYYFFFL